MAGRAVKLNYGIESLVSYLPLSHVAAQVLDIYIPLLYAGAVYFAQPDALRVRLTRCHQFSSSVLLYCCNVLGCEFVRQQCIDALGCNRNGKWQVPDFSPDAIIVIVTVLSANILVVICWRSGGSCRKKHC